MKSLSLLGSTGSIGVQVLKVVGLFKDRFRIVGLAAGRNLLRLREQIIRFRPKVVSVASEKEAEALRKDGFPGFPLEVLWGEEGHQAVATLGEVDMVVSAMVGAVGLRPTMAAIRAGKAVALANKETLVMAGELIMKEVKRKGVSLLPVDSEHSAVFQVLQGQRREALKRILLTASGGPFRDFPLEAMEGITGAQALNHPRWKMGPKITVDSATLMNKGLEVMEARWLFDVDLDRIEILIHPQSVVHSLVEFQDGSLIAQMGWPDMIVPIAYALSYPERMPLNQPSLDLTAMQGLHFFKPDLIRFPCLRLALEAAREGGSMPVVLNAANEEAVASFLAGRLPYPRIAEVIEKTMSRHQTLCPHDLEEVLAVDAWARREARSRISGHGGTP